MGIRLEALICLDCFSSKLTTKKMDGGGFVLEARTSHKIVILSGAPHIFIARHSACSAQPKDPEGPYLADAARVFSTTDPRFKALHNAGDGKMYP